MHAFRSLLGFLATFAGVSAALPHGATTDRSCEADCQVPRAPSMRLRGAGGEGFGRGAPGGKVAVYLELEGAPAVEAYLAHPGQGAASASRRRLRELATQHEPVKAAAEALGATVLHDFTKLTNAVEVLADASSLGALARIEGVVGVHMVPIVQRGNTSAVRFVGAYNAWSTSSLHGEGVRIGIVDTGIDYTHADFGGAGDPAVYKANDPATVEPGSFPTMKVVGGVDLVGDDYDASSLGKGKPKPDDDPLDCAGQQSMNVSGGHGTHVAGTAAGQGVTFDGKAFDGPYDASVDPSMFVVGPGVAPAASLYAIKVFGCTGSTALSTAGIEWTSDPNGDGDFGDRLDVINLSLGGSYGSVSKVDDEVMDNLLKLGTFVAVAAGNDGDTFYVTGTPSTHVGVTSVAATVDQLLYDTVTVTSPQSLSGDIIASEGAFTKPLPLVGTISGELVAVAPKNGCQQLTNAGEVAGKIALIDRGSCTFVNKVKNAETAGAIAVIVVDNENSDLPFSMAGDGSSSSIPGLMVRKTDGDKLRAALPGVQLTLDPKNDFASSSEADHAAGFSSRGPRVPDNLLKPDVAAPGVAINSAGVGTGNGPRELQGTSMACPVVAGAGALLKQAHPDLSPIELKTLLMNTAHDTFDDDGNLMPVSRTGAGRIQVDKAATTRVLAFVTEPQGAVSISFGAVVAANPTAESRSITVVNKGKQKVTLLPSTRPTVARPGVQVVVNEEPFELGAGESKELSVSLQFDPAQLDDSQPDQSTASEIYGLPRHYLNEAGGWVVLTDQASNEQIRVPYHAVLRPVGERIALYAPTCTVPPKDEPVTVPLTGPSANPRTVVSAFQLGGTSTERAVESELRKATDLIAVGAATNLGPSHPFTDASIYFGIAVSGEWPTPAIGPTSAVTVAIDTNGDEKEDYRVRAEPYSAQGPYLDALVATTYSKGGDVVSQRYVNIYPPDELPSHPFNNGVLVMGVSLDGIGLSAGNAKIKYRAISEVFAAGQTAESTPWADFDAERPILNPSPAGHDGRPIFAHDEPLKVLIDAEAAAGAEVPKLLVLHHTNKRGMRVQTLSLVSSGDEVDLGVTQKAPATVTVGQPAEIEVTVTNKAAVPAKDVVLEVSIGGADVKAVGAPCVIDKNVSCSFGEIAAGGQVKSTISVVSSKVGKVVSTAQVLSKAGCERAPEDNASSFELTATPPMSGAGGGGGGPLPTGGSGGAAGAAGGAGAAGVGAKAGAPGSSGSAGASARGGAAGAQALPTVIEAGGGCDCSVGHQGRDASGHLSLASLGALSLLLRRRRRSGDAFERSTLR